MSPGLFDETVKDGRMPGPKHQRLTPADPAQLAGSLLWRDSARRHDRHRPPYRLHRITASAIPSGVLGFKPMKRPRNGRAAARHMRSQPQAKSSDRIKLTDVDSGMIFDILSAIEPLPIWPQVRAYRSTASSEAMGEWPKSRPLPRCRPSDVSSLAFHAR